MADEAASPNKGGRPAKYPGEGKRPTLTFRCRGALQDSLKAAAQDGDRSVSEEVERRLESSFREQDQTKQAAQAAVEGLLDLIYRDVGGKDNWFSGVKFAVSLNAAQIDADKIFSSTDPWYTDPHKLQYVKEWVASSAQSILFDMIGKLRPESKIGENPSKGPGLLNALLVQIQKEAASDGDVSSQSTRVHRKPA